MARRHGTDDDDDVKDTKKKKKAERDVKQKHYIVL